MKKIFNGDFIVSISIYDKEHIWQWEWKYFKKRFFTSIKEGWHYHSSLLERTIYNDDEIVSYYKNNQHKYVFIEDRKLFKKPYINITFVNKENYIKYFDTYNEAKIYGEYIAENFMKKQLLGSKGDVTGN